MLSTKEKDGIREDSNIATPGRDPFSLKQERSPRGKPNDRVAPTTARSNGIPAGCALMVASDSRLQPIPSITVGARQDVEPQYLHSDSEK